MNERVYRFQDSSKQKKNTSSTQKQDAAQRAQLIQTGNKFLNENKFKEAEKIFKHIHYYDGLARLARVFAEKGNMLKAYLLFKHINAKEKDIMENSIIECIRGWLHEDTSDKRLSPSSNSSTSKS